MSVSTVSRVLNEKDDVAPETYERVQDVIKRLGYTSSLAARSMRSHRTNVIGLIMPDVSDPFGIQVIKGVSRAITELDYDLIIYTSGSSRKPTTAEREKHYVSLLNGTITDGMIVVTPLATSFPTSAPVVSVDPNAESPEYPGVISTNRAGAVAAVGHLIRSGHRRIGFIGGRPDLRSANQRLQGYLEALGRAGIPRDPALIESGDYSAETGRLCARRLLALSTPPTAIFAANDQSALGVLAAARETGLRVPWDLSVVGFDNIPESAYSQPALTTVDQFIDQMGYLATEMLISLVQGEPLDGEHREIATQLVVRDSCRAIAGGNGVEQGAARADGAGGLPELRADPAG